MQYKVVYIGYDSRRSQNLLPSESKCSLSFYEFDLINAKKRTLNMLACYDFLRQLIERSRERKTQNTFF